MAFDRAVCVAALEAAKARRLTLGTDAWELRPRGWIWSQTRHQYNQARKTIIKALLDESPFCYLQVDAGDPEAFTLGGEWARPAPGLIQPPSDSDPDALQHELITGEYVLYCAATPVPASFWQFDAWKERPQSLKVRLSSQGIYAAVIPFVDDIEWRVLFPALV